MPKANDEVAEVMQEFADLLSILGGDRFKIRAYEKAARTVAGFPEDVAVLATEDPKRLKELAGIGKAIAEKIVEFEQTGSVSELEDLRAEVPAGVRALLDIPGLGPKKALRLSESLSIASITELLDALHDHRVAALKGFGAKTEENLLKAIKQMRESGGRIHLGVALSLAEEALEAIEHLPEVEKATYAGSLRRMKETIGDIDLLVASDDPKPVMEAFTTMPLVADVLAHGATKSAVITTKGIQIDLRVVEPGVWGAALQYFTGSKEHNVKVRELAVRKDLKLSEYGLFRAEDGKRIAAHTEEEVYERLGLGWIPPTMREDTGEIEASLAGDLPVVVELADIRGDLHGHTDLTDGIATLGEMVAAAEALRYEYFAITDHAELLRMLRMTRDKILSQRAEIARLQRTSRVEILHGSELNIQPDGSVDWDDDFLAGFDVLVASVHSHFGMARDEMTKRIVTAMENPYVNVIGHPTARLLGRRNPIEFDADEVFKAAARTGTALEVNSFPDRLDLSAEMLRRARDFGTRFAISTDAHATVHLANMRFGVATAERGWVEPAQVINTYPLEELRTFLRKGRAG